MTVEEQRLSEWLQESTPEPPRAVTVEDVAAAVHRSPAVPRSRRLRSVVLPLVAAACAAGLAIGLAVGLSDDHHAAPATRSSTPTRPSPTEPSPTVTPAPIGKDLATIPWPAHLVALEPSSSRLMPNSMLTSAGRLYAVLGPGPYVSASARVWSLVRINPANGEVLAHSSAVQALGRPVAADGLIWTTDAEGHLSGFDPVSLSLRISRQIATRAQLLNGLTPSLAADGHHHAALVGVGRQVIAVDTRTGVIQRRLDVDGQIGALALSPNGSKLYVDTRDGTGGRLVVVDPMTGAVLSGPVETNAPLAGSFIATAGGLWGTFSGGMMAGIEFRSNDPRDQQRTLGGGSGGGLDVAPTLSGGVIWAGGFDLACDDPESGHTRAYSRSTPVHPLGYMSDLTVLGHTLYAIYSGSNPQSALITLQPPAACGLR